MNILNPWHQKMEQMTRIQMFVCERVCVNPPQQTWSRCPSSLVHSFPLYRSKAAGLSLRSPDFLLTSSKALVHWCVHTRLVFSLQITARTLALRNVAERARLNDVILHTLRLFILVTSSLIYFPSLVYYRYIFITHTNSHRRVHATGGFRTWHLCRFNKTCLEPHFTKMS